MNEFERRLLECVQNHNDLVSLVKAAGPGALVEHFAYTWRMDQNLGQGTVIKPILSDAWFVLQYVGSCVQNESTFQWFTDSGQVQLQLTDTGTGEILFSQPLSAGVLTGTVSRAQSGTPMMLPVPRLIPPGTIIKADVVVQGAADVDVFFLTLGGSRIAQA